MKKEIYIYIYIYIMKKEIYIYIMCDCLYVCLKKRATPRALTISVPILGICAS